MTVVDTSALVAVLSREPAAGACAAVLAEDETLMMSAATLAECLIVGGRRGFAAPMARIVEELQIEISPVGRVAAVQAASAYERWGKGVHPAGLNFGDCFAYSLAMARRCPLLYVGRDFAQTDVISAIPR